MKNSNTGLTCGPWLRTVLCLIVGASSSQFLLAQQQQPQQQQQPDQAPPSPAPWPQDVTPVVLQLPSNPQTIALLGTDQRFVDLEALQTRRRTFFMYGMGITESYSDNFGGGTGNSSEALWSPHVALINASNHSSISFQYAPSLAETTSGPSEHELFHTGSFSFSQPIAPNWFLQFGSSNTYGTDGVRLLSPLGFEVKDGVPMTDPSSAVFQLERDKVFTSSNNLNLGWQRSPSQAMNFSFGESYFSSLNGGPHSSIAFGQASYSVAVTPRTGLNLGGNYYHGFTQGSCDSYGFTVGISHQLSRHVNISLGGGPEFASSPCSKGLGGNYTITVSLPLSRVSRLGLTAGRSYTTTYLANTQWSDTAAASYGRQLSEAIGISLNSGYDRSVRTVAGLGAYVGYFAGADFSWKLARTIALTASYRRFEQVSGGPDQGQNVAMISLGWNALPIRIVK